MVKSHADGNQIVYTSCGQNGCWGRCVLKVHVKNGVITAIENDDTINSNDAREDLDEDAYRKAMVQIRACVRGRGWRKIVYDPNRLLYPMKRAGERGSGQWKRISWEEALDTTVAKMKEALAKHGPYSVTNLIPGIGSSWILNPIAPWAGFGFSAWGMASWAGHELAQLLTTGHDWRGIVNKTEFDGNEAPDLLNAEAIIMWGWNPAITNFDIAHYLMLAKERGIPIIVIDPVYTVSAEAYGSQWIPIRPGTDTSALLAITQVLFQENLYDQDFVSRFVEAEGLEEFRRYVTGDIDGVTKTPEWAEKICGVPADTLRGLARLIVKKKPTFFKLHWSVARKMYGETTARLGMFIPAMTGNLGIPGTCSGGISMGFPPYKSLPFPQEDWRRSPPTYKPPVLMHARKLADAILLKEDLESGRLTEDEYRRHIGAPPKSPLADPHVVFMGREEDLSGSVNGCVDSNKQMRALEKMDFIFVTSPNLNHHRNLMADILLPVAEPFFETARGFSSYLQGNMSNYFMCCFKSVDPPGEARPNNWVWLEIAKRFGKAEAYNGRLANVPYDQWDEVYEEVFREAYETWANQGEVKTLIPDPPSWGEFKKQPIIRVPLSEAFYPHKEQIKGKKSFDTPSGKIEFAPKILRDPEFPRKGFRDRFFGGAIRTQFPAIPEWKASPDSPTSKKAEIYPLFLLTPHSTFRQHSAQDNNPWFRDEYRHAVWVSVADAKARGVNDGELVHVYNDKGEMILPAYVTSRVTPGTVIVFFGAWYTPGKVKSEKMPYGIDMRGNANLLTHDDLYPWVVGNLNCSNLVDLKKAPGSLQGEFS